MAGVLRIGADKAQHRSPIRALGKPREGARRYAAEAGALGSRSGFNHFGDFLVKLACFPVTSLDVPNMVRRYRYRDRLETSWISAAPTRTRRTSTLKEIAELGNVSPNVFDPGRRLERLEIEGYVSSVRPIHQNWNCSDSGLPAHTEGRAVATDGERPRASPSSAAVPRHSPAIVYQCTDIRLGCRR